MPARPTTLHFAAAANSFFTILVFNNLLRGPESGSIALTVQDSPAAGSTPPATVCRSRWPHLSSNLSSKNLLQTQAFDLTVRDAKTGFIFFNIEGHQYDYDSNAQSLSITGGKLLLSQDFANALGRPWDAGAIVGKISIGAAMQPIEVQRLVNGEIKSMVMPPCEVQPLQKRRRWFPGPMSSSECCPKWRNMEVNGNFVGLGIGTTSCNNGDQALNWFPLPQTDHPVHSAEFLPDERRCQ